MSELSCGTRFIGRNETLDLSLYLIFVRIAQSGFFSSHCGLGDAHGTPEHRRGNAEM